MIMDTDAVEACLLAAGDERGEVGQRSPNRDSQIDADPGHLTKAPSFSSLTIRSFLRNENRAKRFCPATHRSALGTGRIIGESAFTVSLLSAVRRSRRTLRSSRRAPPSRARASSRIGRTTPSHRRLLQLEGLQQEIGTV